MTYFLRHLIYIVIAAAVIAVIGIISVLAARKNSENRTEEETKERLNNCGTCVMSAICMDMGQTHHPNCKETETVDE